MTTDWYNACGVAPYRFHDDGRIEVQGAGFPDWSYDSAQAEQISAQWQRWGPAITDASKTVGIPAAWINAIMYIESKGNPDAAARCEPVYCPALWNRNLCADQGGPYQFCAGGLMAFTEPTAKTYGKSIDYYMQHPEEQIVDGADLLAKNTAAHGGDACAGAKVYNGGSVCGGGGLIGMGGQNNYVEGFIRAANTTKALGLAEAGVGVGAGVFVASLVLATVGYMFLDIHYGWTNKLVRAVQARRR